MLSLFPHQVGNRLTRRSLLRLSALAAGGLAIPRAIHAAESVVGVRSAGRATAKRCIYIFLCGGPSQGDLWDLKPNAPSGIRTIFKPIQTTVPGLHFSELLPQVAQHAHKLALIRSMTHANNDHNGAIVHTLLGQVPARPGDFYASRTDHPGIGGILHKLQGNCGPLPAWVVLPRPFTTYSPPYKGQSAGFLGSAFDPVTFNKPAKGSLSDARLELDSLQPADGVDNSRLAGRMALHSRLAPRAGGSSHSATMRLDDHYGRALSLLSDPAARQVFDLETEPPSVRDRYGRNEYGQSLLMARRLIEAGVRFVNVFWTFFDDKGCQFNLWDNHGVATDVCGVDGQRTGIQQLTHQYCTPSFDRSFSALLDDLTQRGLLDDTLVAVAGEFGRTPKINQTSGRDHWAHCYTQLLAGGGVEGGAIYGSSDAHGAYVQSHPVTPDDFAATVLHAFGLESDAAILDPTGRPVRICSGSPVTSLFRRT